MLRPSRRALWYGMALASGLASIGLTSGMKYATGAGYSIFASFALLSMLFGGFGPMLVAGWTGLVGYVVFFALPRYTPDLAALKTEHVRLGTAFVMYFLAAVVGGLYRQSRRRNLERQNALHDAAASVREVLDGATDGILVTGLDGRFEFGNVAMGEMLGYAPHEIVGMTAQQLITPDSIARKPFRLEDLQDGHPVLVERDLFRKDGSVAHVEVSARVMSDGRLVSALRDISDRIRSQRALRDKDERLERITSAIPGVVFQFQINAAGAGQVLYVSSVVEQLLGVSAAAYFENRIGMWQQVHPDDQDVVNQSLKRSARSMRTWSQEFRMHAADDSWIWVSSRAVPERAPDNDGVIWNGVLEDITARRALEDELRQAQKIESIGRLAGGIAHDFNNLLTAILGHADMLVEDLPKNTPAVMSAEQILAAAQSGSVLTRQLLGFARRQVVAPKIVNINDVVSRVPALIKPMLGELVQLRTRLDPDAGNVRLDPSLLEQVLVNLAVNAKDAMPSGGALEIRTQYVPDEALDRDMHPTLPEGPLVNIDVRDTGQGMSEETRRRAFEPFFTTKPSGQGTGLGLANSYGVVTQAGGTIFIVSEPNKGTNIRMFFPASRDAVAEPEVATVAGPVSGRETVLVVDDEALARRVTSQALARQGYNVLQAENAGDALAIARSTNGPIHLLVTDVVMPGVNGHQLAAQLTRERPATRVLYVSGYTDGAIDRADSAVPLLSKPYDIAELARCVRTVLDAKR